MAFNLIIAEKLIVLTEESLFLGAFSESIVKNDLETRKAMDRLSKMGSKGATNALAEKKDVYFRNFAEWREDIDTVLKGLRGLSPAKMRFSSQQSNKEYRFNRHELNDWQSNNDVVSEQIRELHSNDSLKLLISRCKRCKKQIKLLHKLVKYFPIGDKND